VFITEHVIRARDKYNPDAIEQAAEADAAGFEWPAAAMHQDADEVRTEGSLRGAIEAKIEAHRSQRFNAERVDALFSADPEYDTLRSCVTSPPTGLASRFRQTSSWTESHLLSGRSNSGCP